MPRKAASGDEPILFQESVSLQDLAVEAKGPETEAAEMPCAINALTSGLSGGVLGFAFGFVPKVVGHRGSGRWKASVGSGWESAKTFAIMGGLYTFASCFSKRLRQKEDAINGGVAGCATGLALGWNGGPVAAVQSCLGFGLFSLVLDYMGGGAAEAAGLASTRLRRTPQARLQPVHFLDQFVSPVAAMLTPAAMGVRPMLSPCANSRACIRQPLSGMRKAAGGSRMR